MILFCSWVISLRYYCSLYSYFKLSYQICISMNIGPSVSPSAITFSWTCSNHRKNVKLEVKLTQDQQQHLSIKQGGLRGPLELRKRGANECRSRGNPLQTSCSCSVLNVTVNLKQEWEAELISSLYFTRPHSQT